MSRVLRLDSRLLSLAACLLALPLAAQAATNNLTYAARLGYFASGNAVTNVDATGEAALTVTLYASQTATKALWSRRVETYLEQGLFSVELTDAAGTDDGSRETTYAQLNDLLAALGPTDALWVEVSNVTVDGRTVFAGGLPRGRIGGVPFAICADRAAGASGDFDVNGDLTVTRLTTRGAAFVTEGATFAGQTVFEKDVTFGSAGLAVTGLLAKPTVADLATLKAVRIDLYGTLKAQDLAVTNAAGGCTLSAASGARAPGAVRVAGEISSSQAITVAGLEATTLTVSGTLALKQNNPLADTFTALSIPDGVYAVTAEPLGQYTEGAYSPTATARHSLSALSVAAGDAAAITAANDGAQKTWCRLQRSGDGPQVVTTALVPLPRNKTYSSSHGAVTVSRKELE